MNPEKLNQTDSVSKVLNLLVKLYLKNKSPLVYKSNNVFEKFKRPQDMGVAEYATKFKGLYVTKLIQI